MSHNGKFAYEKLDRILHEKARLGIMTSLLSNPKGLSFNLLKEYCSLTDGNLSRHLQHLNDAGLIAMSKDSSQSRNQSIYSLTKDGKQKFLQYLTELERVLLDATQVIQNGTSVKSLKLNTLTN